MSPIWRWRAPPSSLANPFNRLPIRVRLAAVSTALTFVILCSFAAVVGDLTVERIRTDFYRQAAASADDLATNLHPAMTGRGVLAYNENVAAFIQERAAIRLLTPTSPDGDYVAGSRTPRDLGPLQDLTGNLIESRNVDGYRVENRYSPLDNVPGGQIVVQYALPLSDVDATIGRVHVLLVIGVLAGTGLALLAGLMIARRAMAPIARLTTTAGEIARTGDPRRSVPSSGADDEVAELARTFDEMLRSLDAARGETEAMLVQQRQFVADASHELRTPLTSVLANLELLAESLDGEQGEAARSALRSSQRMRRLVADLLLLARSDVDRVVRRGPTDLGEVVIEAAGELGPVSSGHTIELDAQAAVVNGVHDDLLRLALNLIENAIRHTPPGTVVSVATGPSETAVENEVQIVVADNGPGVPAEVAPRLFERFVRGTGDRGGSFGLGLAIVRAVAEAHGGTVTLEASSDAGGAQRQRGVQAQGGARFVVRLPGLGAPTTTPEPRPQVQLTR